MGAHDSPVHECWTLSPSAFSSLDLSRATSEYHGMRRYNLHVGSYIYINIEYPCQVQITETKK